MVTGIWSFFRQREKTDRPHAERHRDVTPVPVSAHRQASGAGEPLDASLAALTEALPDPFLLLARDGAIVHANDAARAVFERATPGRQISAIIRAPRVLEALAEVTRAGGKAVVDYEQRVPLERHFEVHISAIAGPHRDQIAVLMRDLTRQEQVERMRADFVANASHELRTPLASVLGFIETLQGPARNDEQARDQFLDLMRAQATRMARLIDDLLSLNRIELNVHQQPADKVHLVQVVGHVADIMRPLAQEAGVTLEVRTPDQAVVVRGDRDELVQVVQNLVENAVKYGQSGQRVEIDVERGDTGFGRVSVRDFGPGIAPEHVPRLTERFYRVDVGESRSKGGTGLGLAIVKHILNRHRAKLSIRTRIGEGACFMIDLPIAET